LLVNTALDLPAGIDTTALATALMALFFGMRVPSRAQTSPGTVTPILRQIDTMIGCD